MVGLVRPVSTCRHSGVIIKKKNYSYKLINYSNYQLKSKRNVYKLNFNIALTDCNSHALDLWKIQYAL